MAGSSLSEAGEPQAYLFNRKGGGVNVGALTGKTRSWLTGLNAKGWAVGYAETAGSRRTQAFRYKDGKVVWLGALSEGGSTYVAGINAGWTAVGSSESVADDFMSYRAVTWKGKSGPVNLGTLFDLFTHGEAINSTGVVVGRYGLGAAGMRVSNGVMSNLVNLIPADKKVLWDGLLGRAVAISDNGMIVGANSRYNGVNGAAYLMRPSP
jgi:probable HAF family extracellular repeat protein